MQSWNAIVHTAMMGTDKKTVGANEVDGHLAEAATLIENNETLSREEKFLQLAALTFNYRQCGVSPIQKEVVDLKASSPEELPYCSPLAMQALKDIMEQGVPGLFNSWLITCERSRQIAWPEILPALLEEGVRQKNSQPLVAAVCGKRGDWLASFNENWSFSVKQDDGELWQTGTTDIRKNILKQLRMTDRSKAMELLQQTWPTEDLNTKLALLEVMGANANKDDLEFLETLTAEKSKKLKDAALLLMTNIEGSRVVKLYEDLLRQSVSVKKEKGLLGLGSKSVLQFQLPESIDEEVFKAGIDKLSPDKNISDERFMLYQVIGRVPPTFWENHLGMGVEEIVRLFDKTDDGKALFPAIGLAVGKFKTRSWASHLLNDDSRLYLDIFPLLEPEVREKYIVRSFTHASDSIINVLVRDEHEWSPAIARMILRHCAKFPYQYSKSFFTGVVHLLPLQMESEIEAISPEEEQLKSYWANTREHISKLLRLKSQLQKAFNN